jgi:hypothetical protein
MQSTRSRSGGALSISCTVYFVVVGFPVPSLVS